MALSKISDILLVIFFSVSVPIYIVFIITVLRNRAKEPFNSAFFTLCISLGIADLVNELQTYLFVKPAGWGWFKDFWLNYGSLGSALAFYGLAMSFVMGVNQHFALFLSINRFTAIVFPYKHDKLWSKQRIKMAIGFQWIFPIIFVLPMLTSQFEYTFYINHGVQDNDSISVNFCDDNYETAYYISSSLINFFINASTFGMYIMVLTIAIKQTRKKNRAIRESVTTSIQALNQQRQNRKQFIYQRELRLACSGFLLFLAMLSYFTFPMLVLITGDPDFDGGLMYNIVCDVFSCINPYTLLLMSKQTRTAFVRTLKCK